MHYTRISFPDIISKSMHGCLFLFFDDFCNFCDFETDYIQRRSQNLKEVPQNFTEVFNTDDVTANDVIQRNQHRKEKNKLEFHSNH